MYLQDSQDKLPSAICQCCEGEVWPYEVMFHWEGKWICLHCFKAAVNAILDDNPRQVALEMMLEMREIY